jgi:cell division transport system ATP-binding protein
MIRFDNVTKSYKGSIVALSDVSLEITKGEFVFLVGASGSGKTTMLKLLLREETVDTGHIWVAGREINRLSKWRVPYLRRNIGCVFQDFRLLPNKTVSENVAFALEVIGRPRQVIATQVPQVLELVGLGQKGGRFPHELSGGEQQRVAIARAFVNRPLILLADEPTGNLDPGTSQGIMALLDRINRTGTTVVMATHDSGMVDMMRRRVIEIDSGRVVRDQARGIYGIDPATTGSFSVTASLGGRVAEPGGQAVAGRRRRGERAVPPDDFQDDEPAYGNGAPNGRPAEEIDVFSRREPTKVPAHRRRH